MPLDMMEKTPEKKSIDKKSIEKKSEAADEELDLDSGFDYHYLGKRNAARHTSSSVVSQTVKTPRSILKIYTPLIFCCVIVMIAVVFQKQAQRKAEIEADRLPSADTVIITMERDGEITEVKFKDLIYYIRKLELDGEKRALVYDPENSTKYWNLYLDDENGKTGYVSDIAAGTVTDSCIRDVIFAKLAYDAGFEADPDSISDAAYDAGEMYDDIPEDIRNTLGITEEDINASIQKELIAHLYVLKLAEDDVNNKKASSAMQAVELQYDTGGEYYRQVRKEYVITVNTEAWEKVHMGYVTINR